MGRVAVAPRERTESRLAVESLNHGTLLVPTTSQVDVATSAETELVGDQADLCLFLGADRAVGGGDREQGVDDLGLLCLVSEIAQLPDDLEVLRSTEELGLMTGDLDHQHGLCFGQLAVLADDGLHGRHFIGGDRQIRVGDATQGIGEGGDIARPIGVEMLELGEDAPYGGGIFCRLVLARAETEEREE